MIEILRFNGESFNLSIVGQLDNKNFLISQMFKDLDRFPYRKDLCLTASGKELDFILKTFNNIPKMQISMDHMEWFGDTASYILRCILDLTIKGYFQND